jgi:hypothetical protein
MKLRGISKSRRQSSKDRPRRQRRGRLHDFVIEAAAADIELGDHRVVWRLNHTKAVEIIQKLKVLSSSGHPGHHYVDDMFSPAPTLVLSRDQYISPNWLTAGKEPIFWGRVGMNNASSTHALPSLTNTSESNMQLYRY